MTAWLRSIVAGEDSPDAVVGERLVGEFLVNARLAAFGMKRKR